MGGGGGVDGKLVSYVATLELSRVCFMLCDAALQFILQITQTHIFTWAHTTHIYIHTRAHMWTHARALAQQTKQVGWKHRYVKLVADLASHVTDKYCCLHDNLVVVHVTFSHAIV